MAFLIALLTLVMVLDCAVLIFLVLIQLPKKDAGAGLAFGASATDALFGAGSGNVLTKITKYAAGFFFAMAIFLSLMISYAHSRNASTFGGALGKATLAAPGPNLPPQTVPAVTASNAPLVSTGANPVLPESTSNPAAPKLTLPPATNAPK